LLIDHLPPESATKTAVRNRLTANELKEAAGRRDAAEGSWSHVAMLLAEIIDELRASRHALIAGNGGKPGKMERYPRPGVSEGRRKRKTSAADLARLMQLRAEHAARQAQHDERR